MIKAIIFDCFGVFTEDKWKQFCDTLTPGPALDKAKQLNYDHDAGLISLKEFSQGVYEATGHHPDLIEEIMTSPQSAKNQKLLDYVRQLKPSYKIGMISNVASNWIREHLFTEEEQELFDDMVFSFEVGDIKPNPKIYQTAAQNLGVEPVECVFIDDVPRYCQGAEDVGMQAVVYQDFEQMKADLEKLLARAGPDN